MPGLDAIAYVMYCWNWDDDALREQAGEVETPGYDDDDDGLLHLSQSIANGRSYKVYYDAHDCAISEPIYRFAV